MGSDQSWSVVCHLDYGDHGEVCVINHQDGTTHARTLPATEASGEPLARRTVFLGLDDQEQAVLLNPVTKEVTKSSSCPSDIYPAYAYLDPGSNRIWFMNDGDPKTGNDTLNCGENGASVTIVDRSSGELLKTLCVGRGHHVATFVDNTKHGAVTYLSNLIDGSIDVVGNDPGKETFLTVIETINLLDSTKEKDENVNIPNNAFPHGKVFSSVSNKLYNLNNGYKAISVITIDDNTISATVEMPVSSNLLLSPCGRFIIGKGADRKADPDHVMGRISVMDVEKEAIVAHSDLQDVYPSTYRFSPNGEKLYVTTAATGKDAQRDNLALNALLVFDAKALPELKLEKTVAIGKADCGRRPIAFLNRSDASALVFIPNPTDGSLSVLDEASDEIVETVKLTDKPVKELLFSFWRSDIHGC